MRLILSHIKVMIVITVVIPIKPIVVLRLFKTTAVLVIALSSWLKSLFVTTSFCCGLAPRKWTYSFLCQPMCSCHSGLVPCSCGGFSSKTWWTNVSSKSSCLDDIFSSCTMAVDVGGSTVVCQYATTYGRIQTFGSNVESNESTFYYF